MQTGLKYKYFLIYYLNSFKAPPHLLSDMIKTYSANNEVLEYPQIVLKDVYPNNFGEGLGEGHREAIKCYVEKRREKK